MASAEFYPGIVVAAGRSRIADLRKKMAAAHEARITEMMATPYGGFWPFSKPRLRTREECEAHYGSETQYLHTHHWWTELPYRRLISRIQAIVDLADATPTSRVVLSEDEANDVGLTKDSWH